MTGAAEPSGNKVCYECKASNPNQPFCGSCGSPLDLNAYVASKVKSEVRDSIGDRDVVERITALNVFEKVWGWLKLIGAIAAVLVLVAGVGIVYKVNDFWSGVDSAKKSVSDTAAASKSDISQAVVATKNEITSTATDSKKLITDTSSEATHRAQSLTEAANKSKADLAARINSFNSDLGRSRKQLEQANELQPKMTEMQDRLTKATTTIEAQQKTLSSSEDFVRQVFSSHMIEYFQVGVTPKERLIVEPPPATTPKTSIVFMVLGHTPIPQTLQLQWHVFAQPPNSFVNLQNLVIFFWSDTADKLSTDQLMLSYFPDMSDKDLIKTVSLKNGRYYADDEPLPKFNEPDPDFKGNKWLKIQPNDPHSFVTVPK